MRLIHTFHNDQEARTLAAFLTEKGITNQLELLKNTDWGSPEYGNIICHLWVIEEEHADEANKWLKRFLQDPEEPIFASHRPDSSLLIQSFKDSLLHLEKKPEPVKPKAKASSILTLYMIIGCTLLFIFTGLTSNYPDSMPKGLSTPIFSSPIKQALFYDYPRAYELIHKLIATYGYNVIKDPGTLPREGYALLIKSQHTPFWGGLYAKVIDAIKSPLKPLNFNEPMFEKIQKGEIWRLISPGFLHEGALHLLFNMLWLLVLGTQIEQRIGSLRYLLFVLITGAFSNTAQYLMSGPNFLGFSGIISAMILFVWIRQKKTPWERYQLLPSTMIFVSIFILGFAGLQVISFLLEITGQKPIGIGIANTAHLSGAFAGYILAQLNFFRAK